MRLVPARCGYSKSRYARIDIKHRAERDFQRTQPRLVVPPLIDPLGENRPANLFRTGRQHTALGFVKAQAFLFEGHGTIFEQPADLFFGITDDILIEDAVYPARQHRIEMRHQLDVVAIVAAHIAEIVGGTYAAGEVLLEIGKAAGERVTA